MRSRSHRASWFIVVGLVACQEPPDISAEIADYADLVSVTNGLACNCPQDLGFATIAECNDELGTVGSGERQCIADALDGHEDVGKDYLDCANTAYRVYTDCLEANASCEPGGLDGCSDDRDAAVAACPQLPAGVQAQFDACTP